MSKTDETRRVVIEEMVDGLNDHRIADIGEFFTDGFRWMGNQAVNVKTGLREFQDNWQNLFKLPLVTKFASISACTWGNGPRRLAGKRRRTVVSSWGLSPPVKKSKSAIWISGKWLMVRSSTTG